MSVGDNGVSFGIRLGHMSLTMSLTMSLILLMYNDQHNSHT